MPFIMSCFLLFNSWLLVLSGEVVQTAFAQAAASPSSDIGTKVFADACGSTIGSAIDLPATFPFFVTQSSVTRYSPKVESTDKGETLYAMYQCRGDLSLSDCHTCLVTDLFAKGLNAFCPISYNAKEGRVMLKGCYFAGLYDNNLFNDTTEKMQSKDCNGQLDGTSEAFQANLKSALNQVLTLAPENGGFYAASAGTGSVMAYALAQCMGYLKPDDCRACLELSDVCAGSVIGSVYYTSCFFLYSDSADLFFDSSVVNGSSSTTPAAGSPPSASNDTVASVDVGAGLEDFAETTTRVEKRFGIINVSFSRKKSKKNKKKGQKKRRSTDDSSEDESNFDSDLDTDTNSILD
ncbi:hypothetical protein L7F22_021665 [Adiantum nelumboides]|nr:hypothetical protein [Adiantum nelumboides]